MRRSNLILSLILSSLMGGFASLSRPSLNVLNICYATNDDSEINDCSGVNNNPIVNSYSQPFEFMYYYFSNLSYNFGNNDVGSCGYVAMSSLLTYYDTFYDDNIVPETYDSAGVLTGNDVSTCVSSPGTYREAICPDVYRPTEVITGYNLDGTPIKYSDYTSYKNWINLNFYTTCLHTKLIIDYIGTTSSNGPGVNQYTYENVFDTYFATIGYSSYLYNRSPVGSTSYEVREWTIEQICTYHKPVILGIPGHVTIAYDYDEDTDSLYVHQGWLGNTHCLYSGVCSDAHTLSFTGVHVCSDNYLYGGHYYCECELASHIHNLKILSLGSSGHKRYCYCGYEEFEQHHMQIIQLKPRRIYSCSDGCGYTTFSV